MNRTTKSAIYVMELTVCQKFCQFLICQHLVVGEIVILKPLFPVIEAFEVIKCIFRKHDDDFVVSVGGLIIRNTPVIIWIFVIHINHTGLVGNHNAVWSLEVKAQYFSAGKVQGGFAACHNIRVFLFVDIC